MQGLTFLILDRQGTPINHGVVYSVVTDKIYMCAFARKPSSMALRSIDEMRGWLFFPDEDAMNDYVAAIVELAKPKPEGEDDSE